jgi:serine/threonine-protein kinase
VIAKMSQAQGLIGEKLGSFRIESVLGSGAMGVVYRGTNEKSGRIAAIKVVSGELARGGKIRERFDREADILQQFRHPGIVRFLAWGRFRGTSYIAMEYVQGVTLEKLLQERGALPWREVVELAVQICDALHYAHEHGVVHRDLKPSNLMVTADNKVKLTDFGIAKDLDAEALTATGRTLGTAAYMSPEQIRGTPAVSHKTDLYALGVVLYQMLVGKVPFDGSSPVVLMHCHLNEDPPRPSAHVQEIPKVLDDLIVELMAKSPAERPWDAAAVGAKLGELLEKASLGKSVAMVWPEPGSAASNPPRAGMGSLTKDPSRRKSRKSKSQSSLFSSSGTQRLAESSDSWWFSRSAAETGLLALALLAIGAFIIYWILPPGQEYLYRHAEALMASTRRADWLTAREEYLDQLDERFPSHPYREQVQKWRDKILLDEAEGRAKVLASGIEILSEPKNNPERQFVLAHTLAREASKRHDDLEAVRQWKELAHALKETDPDEHQWQLLAQKRAHALDNAIKDRRTIVEKQLEMAETALRAGRVNEAMTIRSKLVDEYSKFTDLADLFPPQSQPVPPSPETKPAPAGDKTPAASPSTEAPPPSKTDRPNDSGEPAPKETPKESPARRPEDSSPTSPSTDP